MFCSYRSVLLNEEDIQPIEEMVEAINKLISPTADTGELIINYLDNNNEWRCLYEGTLNGGSGKSCAAKKIATLINHPEYDWGGIIPEIELATDEKKWYGSIRLKNCRDLEGDWVGQVIIAFSGRKEWQDALYVAGIIQILKEALKINFKLPEGINNDPTWGTVLNICKALHF